MFDDPLEAARCQQQRRRRARLAFVAAVEIAKQLPPRAQRAAIRNLFEHAITNPDLKEDSDGDSLPRPCA
jgi:hypothetical protein